jgi:gluconolactonase
MGKLRPRELDLGFIYWARADGSEIREVISGMITPNGIGLSPDGKRLYVAETIPGRVWSWEITGPGEVRRRPWPASYGATFIGSGGGHIRFDSLAVAASGNICLAALDSCAILEMNTDGAIVRRHAVPDLVVTNICFGGAGLRTAYVTMSHQGKLAALEWPEPGLPLHHVDYPR